MAEPANASRSAIATVAERAGVSIATVSRVVNGISNKASAETTARVWKAVEELGYRPGSVGRALRQKTSRLVAVLAANLANPAMTAMAASIETALRDAGLVMVLCDTHDRADLQDEYLLEMRAQLACAVVLLGAVPSKQLALARKSGEALVFVNRSGPDANAAFVGIDNFQAGVEVARFFAEAGVTHPVVLSASRMSSATDGRVAGFLSAFGTEPMIVPPRSDDHLSIGYSGVVWALDRGPAPCGVFCTSDLIAYGAHRRLTELGLRVPKDVLVTGFDDNPLNDWLAPWLSSVRVPYDLFGGATLEAIRAVQKGGTARIVLPYRMVDRTENQKVAIRQA
jgi:LacI family transcriptional regulator